MELRTETAILGGINLMPAFTARTADKLTESREYSG